MCDEMNKEERGRRGLEELRDLLEEIVEEGNSRHPGINATIDAARGLEGLDRAEDALRKWDERDINGEWRDGDGDESRAGTYPTSPSPSGQIQGPKFDSPEDGKDALATVHDISPELIEQLFQEVDETAPVLVAEYDLESEVDTEVVSEYLKIALCEDIAWMMDQGVWDGDADVERIIADMEGDYAVSNCTTVAGRVASRHRDMMRVSGAIIKDTFSSSE